MQSRLERLERAGVVTGYGPDIDIAAAGYPVQAFVTLEIAQGSLDKLHRDLASIPGVLEAYATTGTADVLCRVAASVQHRVAADPAPAQRVSLGGPVHQRRAAVHGDRAAGDAVAVVPAPGVVHPRPRFPPGAGQQLGR